MPRKKKPRWFKEAMAAGYRDAEVLVEGCPIHYLSWGDPAHPGLILAHGGLAHAHWWRYLAPLLADSYYVVALDFSGHGDSGHRVNYARNIWAREIMAVCRAAHFRAPPVLIGHSMGGIVSVPAAALHGDELAGIMVIDAPLHRPPKREPERGGGRSFKHIKPYPDLATARGRFRLLPHQECENVFIIDHLAESSLKKTEQGWIWKFDPVMFESLEIDDLEPHLARIRRPWVFLRGAFSEIVPAEVEDFLNRSFGRPMPFVVIPDAHHHLILDQPLAFIAAVRAILEIWGHRTSR